jgi:glycosyltransferase involved in cell wall biosynthesis
MKTKIEISVIIVMAERHDDIFELYKDYKAGLDASGYTYEFIYVIDGRLDAAFGKLKSLRDEGEPMKIIKLARTFGESTAFIVGFRNSIGDTILVLPAYYQVEPSEIRRMLIASRDSDVVIGYRSPRIDSRFNRIQSLVWRHTVHMIGGVQIHDLACRMRAFRRQVGEEVPIYGDHYRFLPLLAAYRGFRVKELQVTQSAVDRFRRVYRPSVYPSRLLDILMMFFLTRFTKKPLRFFGSVGLATVALGGIYLCYVIVQRVFWDIPLAERPAMLLSSLLIVLGVQVTVLGLIGELIIFTHASQFEEHAIEKIIN